eukprot:jgi/Galph1/5861/GphlegSOOS_G4493.1
MSGDTPVELLGKHCSLKECNRLDFLPYTCPDCEQVFCGEHRQPTVHNCTSLKSEKQSVQQLKQLPICSVANCTTISVTKCLRCNQSLCASHRNPESHKCVEQVKTTKTKLEKKHSRNIFEKLADKLQNHLKAKDKPTSKTATTILQMKAKRNAKGNPEIPLNERVYLQVYVDPNLKNVEPIYLFYNKNMTVGRLLDEVCDMFGIVNRNHESTDSRLVFRLTDSSTALQSSQTLSLLKKKDGFVQLVLGTQKNTAT